MRVQDLRLGETYAVEVPDLLPHQQFSLEALGFTVWWQWQRLRGCGFELTVTDLPLAGDADPWVTGVRVAGDPYVEVRLSDDQVDGLGLPTGPGHGYRVVGTLMDRQGQPVTLPKTRRMMVPLSWLHLLGDERPPRSRPLDELT